MPPFEAVEICAGAGGQALGLERAGFDHRLAVELDAHACNTLRENRRFWDIAEGDVADRDVWEPKAYEGVTLLAGGVPCPPFTIAGKQLGATDERDLFAWAVELCGVVQPRALLLENVRGLSGNRFAAYRQHVLDRLRELGYLAEWKLLQASDYGVPQLRPRFVLVALRPEDFPYFSWPEHVESVATVGETLRDLMASRGWAGAEEWAEGAKDIAPTIVGGSKKHGGADLGPTRAKRAWADLGVDALGVADEPPGPEREFDFKPKLTCAMVARIQGWDDRWGWRFAGRKTSVYRQIGNAFPPPVAEAVGTSIIRALKHEGAPIELVEDRDVHHDPVYTVLREAGDYVTRSQLLKRAGLSDDTAGLERHLNHLSRDFEVEIVQTKTGPRYKLGPFRAFLGQKDHTRHEQFTKHRARIS